MNDHPHRLWLALAALLGVSCLTASAAPNILLILTDDQGWSQMSVSPDPRVPEARSDYLETPAMSRLRREGLSFTSGYSPAPLCTPTRRSILCGTTTARSGTEFRSSWVPAEHPTIPKVLKAADANYRCAHFGKWGEQMISTPEECGYDAGDGMTGNATGGMPNSLGVKGGHEDGPPHFVDNEDPKRTRTVTDRAIAFMKDQQRSGHPFYVQVSYYAVHLSVVARQATIEKYRKKGTPDRGYPPAWAAMMEEMDAGVGRLLDALKQMGLAEDTYVFFTADNGGRGTVPGGDTGRAPTNFPLAGAKHSLEEGGIRVPFLVRGPGIPAGSVCHTPVAGYDFLPTFSALAGSREPVPEGVDGVSLVALLKNPRASLERPAQALFFHRPGRRQSAVRQGDHKLMVAWNAQGEMASRSFYQLNPDPREAGRDIASQQPSQVRALEGLLLDYLKSVGAETPNDFPPKGRGKAKGKARKK